VLDFDEETARQIETVYSTPDIVEQREAIRAELRLQPGERVLDIGSGPGFLAVEIATTVGPDGLVHGVDVSESMLAIARHRRAVPPAAPIEFRRADAHALPFADSSFDAVLSTQVYEYVDDLPAALAEAHRVLSPGGRLLVLDTDWDSIVWYSNDQSRMQRILAAWDEHLADPHLPRRLSRLLKDAGFSSVRGKIFPIFNRGYAENTFSAGLIRFVSDFVPGRQRIEETEVAAWARDLIALGDDYFFSLNRYLFVAEKL
jgi:ubiquinone/menaquinone biosynthesis C-methylase UbiE